ncbi:hypothetical protein EVAR_94905_1 [Eumeta japonica]|uniref:C2H2-type domain-containing protein n=1 Tax=Eumeta variegata TaxID=151549 RepID=A0A4C1VAT0_EUMVA|nr:hypothetical protein EVAR_94905_1 [Eumeta japonica]
MSSDYERKFEDMKKYIPFLDSMISRLETCHSTDNPRQAQLNKIRALRDLLLEKNKRMKMENLNKCEQVLKNLYAKVEQSDSFTNIKSVPAPPMITENTENDIENNQTRPDSPNNKSHLRSVCNVIQSNPEGVLFHRRPKKDMMSPIRSPTNNKRRFDETSLSRRNYTRVLVSPDTSRVLYHRRSPKTSSRSPIKSLNKKSPSYRKSKKSSKRRSRSRKPKDINITINVPDKSLNSLNAEDIIERIKKCDDNDVDLDILQGIRKKLFHELKQTGINPDITNFILQSYGNKKKKRKKGKEKEYEEGELSDSESEYIERVYDNIVTDFQSKNEDFSKGKIIKTSSKTEVDSETAVRKIKINFTIAGSNTTNDLPEKIFKECIETITSDSTVDAEILELKNVEVSNTQGFNSNAGIFGLPSNSKKIVSSQNSEISNKCIDNSKEQTVSDDQFGNVSGNSTLLNTNQATTVNIEMQDFNGKNCNISQSANEIDNDKKLELLKTQRENKANFYKPLIDPIEYNANNEIINSDDKIKDDSCNNDINNDEKYLSDRKDEDTMSLTKDDNSGGNSIKIPFILDTTKDVEIKKGDDEIISHIDILAALKKDILSESLDISNKSNEIPALHQPKLIKVTGTPSIAFDINRKKRISLEKYKEKTNPVPKLFNKEAADSNVREEKVKKQSRGLTAKECERFNFSKEVLKDESDKDDDSVTTTESDEGFAPKSPEQNSFDILNQAKEPIIIPTESSANSMIENTYFDTDMRVLDKGLTPTINNRVPVDVEVAAETSDITTKLLKQPNNILKSTSLDPRIKNDNFNLTSIPLLNLGESKLQKFSNNTNLVQDSLNGNKTSLKLPVDHETLKETLTKDNASFSSRVSIWDTLNSLDKDLNAESINVHNPSNNKDRRSECPRSSGHYFGKSDYPQTPTHPFGRTDCPMTPVHPFGMSECPSTPVHSFGRADCPPTPAHSFPFTEIQKPSFNMMDVNNSKLVPPDISYFGTSHPFGVSEMPNTPRHPFGASEMPGTPRHPFGASEMPGTPRHPFGASEVPSTPHHSFGVSEMPGTPRHPFGACEVPGTPRHSFGYSEISPSPFVPFGTEMNGNSNRPFLPSDIPRTPVHPFGASEMPKTPVHPFGRADYPSYNSDRHSTSSQSFGRPSVNYSNDSRQNRQIDYKSNSAGNEKIQPVITKNKASAETIFIEIKNIAEAEAKANLGKPVSLEVKVVLVFKEFMQVKRGRSQQRQFGEASASRRENSIDFQRNNERERAKSQQRQVKETVIPRRENSIGRSNSRHFSRDRSYSREHSATRNIHSENFESRRMRERVNQNRQHTANVGRSYHLNEDVSTEDPGIKHSFDPLNNRNTLDVESHAGRSFTIDTSINRTFQVIKKSDVCFNDQRRRASSVGRSLHSSLRSDISNFDHEQNKQFTERRNNFTRARSMGRDCELNYKIDNKGKSDFEDYKREFEKRENITDKADSICAYAEVNKTNSKDIKNDRYSNKSYKKRDPRMKDYAFDLRRGRGKDYESDHKSSSTRYSNNRDPRLQKTHFQRNGSTESNKHRKSNEDKDMSRKYGIMYTNDNISSGTVLGSGSAVKNYRIPKLKRVILDNDKNDSDDSTASRNRDVIESSDCKLKTYVNRNKRSAGAGSSDKNNGQENENLDNSLTSHNQKTRVRKVSTDSEFEDNVCTDQIDDEQRNPSDNAVKNSLRIQNLTNDDTAKNIKDNLNKFTSDVTNLTDQTEYDLDVFTDLTVPESAPSTEINQLIADLDKDLDNCNNSDIAKISTGSLVHSLVQTNIAIKAQTEESVSCKLSHISLPSGTVLDFKKKTNNMDEVNVFNMDDELKKETSNSVEHSEKFVDDKLNESNEITSNNQKVEKNSEILLEQSPIVSSPQKDKCIVSTQINNYDKDESVSVLNDNEEKKIVEKQINEMCQNNCIIEKDKLEKEDDNVSLVSTSIFEKQTVDDGRNDHTNVSTLLSQSEATFIADSTVNTVDDVTTSREKTNDTLPDSTNENNAVLDCNDKINNASQKEFDKTDNNNLNASQSTTKITSMSNFLTILQGKSKIKELLNMLSNDESPQAEKMRRKLEKLSEIVSDEEDNEKVDDISCDNNETISQMQVNSESVDSTRIGEDLQTAISTSVETMPSKTTTKKIYKKKMRRKTGKMKGKIQISKGIQKAKRTTRSEAAAKEHTKKSKIKKHMSRELMMLQEDIKEMFISDEVLNATGIRMCRLAKLVDDNVTPRKKSDSDDMLASKPKTRKSNDLDVIAKDLESNPLVVLEKVINNTEEFTMKPTLMKPMRKKPGPKPKIKVPVCDVTTDSNKIVEPETKRVKYKPGPLSKTRHVRQNEDNDSEQTDFKSLSETSDYNLHSSESECETLASLKKDYNTENIQNTTAKIKHRRKHCKAYVSKNIKRRKIEIPQTNNLCDDDSKQSEINSSENFAHNIFTDKSYCFYKNQTNYACRFCDFVGRNIAHHYKYKHPHDEIPISRINPIIASEAIKQSLDTNLESLVNICNKKHVCRFCFEVFNKGVNNLESFFWHIVSKHTGEYEQQCTLCPDTSTCSSTLIKPNPPDKAEGLLLGYICEECNFTQISLDNLKYHINKRHNNPDIKIYQISLGDITQKGLTLLIKNRKNLSDASPKTGRSLRSNTKKDVADDKSDITETSDQISESDNSYVSETVVQPSFRYKPGPASKKMQPKIRFEYEDTASETSDIKTTEDRVEVKEETERKNDRDSSLSESFSSPTKSNTRQSVEASNEISVKTKTHDEKREGNLFYGAHFMINVTASGVKEYICCVNGVQNHYKTTLMISLKKHVQMKHKESWDGYCCICKVIVTTLGVHKFQDCLAHFLQNHMDDFPSLQDNTSNLRESLEKSQSLERTESHNELLDTMEQREHAISFGAVETSKKYINVRPLSDLQHQSSCELEDQPDPEPTLLRIESVVSLNPSETRKSDTAFVPESRIHPDSVPTTSMTPVVRTNTVRSDTVGSNGEWTPTSVTDNKHRVVLETMLEQKKLVQIFKCAGKFCSFTTDSAELAVVHATTHQRTGGAGALRCAYCTFESPGSGIDLAAHVFREHGHCQYACRSCFYRASSALLVEEHVRCSHPDRTGPLVVLRAPLATPAPPADTVVVLSRADAVPEYICTYGKKQSGPEQCKFRTYTLGKFLDHYKQRHPDVTSYECWDCGSALEVSSEGSAAAVLAQHQRTHGLCQYHCTYCVFGAETERELIAHAAHAHPAYRPQAYLRHIVESKGPDGNPKLKVLPLVHFNKGSCASLLDVEAYNIADDPVKEAARALDLEKLLGQTALMIEQAMTNNSSVVTSAPALNSPSACIPAPQPAPSPLITETLRMDVSDVSKSLNAQNDHDKLKKVGSAQHNVDDQDRVQITLMDAEAKSKASSASSPIGLLPKIKTEPQDVPAVISLKSSASTVVAVASILPGNATDVICLNSDDENERGTSEVINISDNDDSPSATVTATSSKRVPLANVYKCANCEVIFKTGGGFKRHLSTCCAKGLMVCAYCTFRSEVRHLLAEHQMRDHGPTSQYLCFYCRYTATEISVIDKHVLTAHGIKNPVHNQDLTVKIYKKFIVRGAKATSKLKSDKHGAYTSTPSTIIPATSTRRRYGPADIDALPIAPIVDEPILCAECDFDTKVRVNMVRHLQLHAQRQPAPRTAPVNPVPYLETNEKHFDKMTNLAASSNAVRAEKSSTKDSLSTPFASGRYPQFVPERSRHACGAPDCSYISVDENMLRRHWEALHSTCSVYRCVHCPPDQQLDPALPLTSARIISHLRMHDVHLYVCSGCNIYYHYQQQAVEKHIAEKHPFGASVITVRQPAQTTPTVTPVTATVTSANPPASTSALPSVDSSVSAPTMDLKPWQCGLCEFKSMLRPEVIEHCGQVHNSKMQYKCALCSWRGALYDSASKHCAVAHPGRPAEVLYLYYREGSVSPGPDGSPRWLYQRRLCRPNDRPTQPVGEVKLAPIVSPVDLNLVKSELLDEAEPHTERSETAQSLMERYDKFCDPRDGKYACPLCNVNEDSRDAMTAHLYEELNYRKWSCSMCTYKAFHKVRLMEHALYEHCQTQEPVALPADERLEAWVDACLSHQERVMRPLAVVDNFVLPNETPMVSRGRDPSPRACDTFDAKELEDAFGAFGAPKESFFSCPKCLFTVEEEEKFKDHLEYELAKVRWCCSLCPEKFHRYHEAQLHCKSAHSNSPARAVEASRDPDRRAAWVATVVRTQGRNMSGTSASETIRAQTRPDVEPEGVDNSLLVARYEEPVPASGQRSSRKRRPVNLVEPDSDDERLVIDERAAGTPSASPTPPLSASASDTTAADTPVSNLDGEFLSSSTAFSAFVSSLPEKCPFCEYASKIGMFEHLAKHYNIKPYVCAYCGFNGYRAAVYKHQSKEHGKQPRHLLPVKLPLDAPQVRDVVLNRRCSTVLCLLCGARVLKMDATRHTTEAHPDHTAQLVDPNSVVMRCETCGVLRCDEAAMKDHRSVVHPDQPVSSFASYKLPRLKKAVIVCEHCTRRFKYKREFYAHHEAAHPELELRFTESAGGEFPVSVNPALAAAPAAASSFDSAASVMEIISCDDDENDNSAPSAERARSDVFSAGVVPTITAVTSLASDNAKRKLPDDFDDCISAPFRRVAKKSTTQLPVRADSGTRAVARKSTTQLPLYYVESDSEREETEEEDDTYSWYGKRPPALGELAHVTALMPVPVLNTLMSFTLDKLSEITNISPKVVVRDIKASPDGSEIQKK